MLFCVLDIKNPPFFIGDGPTICANKNPLRIAQGSFTDTVGQGSEKQPDHSPDRVSPLIKEVLLIWAAGAVTSSWKIPSSSGQLPVPVALNARSPTLFGCIIHYFDKKVNSYFSKREDTVNCSLSLGFEGAL